MNGFPINRRRARCWAGPIFPLCLLALSLSGLAQTGPAGRTNRPAPERFLFIIETSAAMQKRAANVQRSIGQLLSVNLLGQLHRGDTIGMWTYNNELHTGEFPLQHWTPAAGREIIIATVQFIQELRYGRQSRLAPVMAQLAEVVADSAKITVILISDGSESPVGTPFDAQIAEVFKLNGAEQRRQAMPFVTILRGLKGKFVSFKVNTPPWPVELPAYPGELTPVAPTPSEAIPASKAEITPLIPPVGPVVVPEPSPRLTETTNAVSPPTPTPEPSVVTVSPVEAPANPPPAAIATQSPPATNIAPAQVEQTTPPPVLAPKPAAATAGADRKIPFMPILVGAGIVLMGIAIVWLALLKRSRQEPRVSLITRSMNKDGK